MINLRPYQEDIIARTRARMAAGVRSLLLQAPTGAGKTCLVAKMLQTAAMKGRRSFFLVHRVELIKQSMNTFVDVGVPHGVIASGFGEDPSQLVQICSVQTLARRYHKVIPPDLIIYDESHHCAAGSWDKLYKAFPSAYHIGLTATPERLDGKGLRPWFSEMILGPSVRWLIDQGYLSDYEIFCPEIIDTSGCGMIGGDFNKKTLDAIIANKPMLVGNAIREYQRHAAGKRVIVFSHSIKKSMELASEFNAAGIMAAHVDGETDMDIRSLEIDRFKRGQIQALTNVSLFGEGFDVPGIDAVSLVSKTNSLGLYLQWVGRALRPVYAPGFDLETQDGRLAAIAAGPKPRALIFDHGGNVLLHGLPDDEREWNLDGKAGRRKDQEKCSVKICPGCFAAQRPGPPRCRFCGFVFEKQERKIETVDGELKKMELQKPGGRINVPPQPGNISPEKIEQGRAKTEEELYRIGVQRGYKKARAWAKHIMQARQRRKLGMR